MPPVSHQTFFLCVCQDGLLEADSRYGCTKPVNIFGSDDDFSQFITCGVTYALSESFFTKRTLAAVKIGERETQRESLRG